MVDWVVVIPLMLLAWRKIRAHMLAMIQVDECWVYCQRVVRGYCLWGFAAGYRVAGAVSCAESDWDIGWVGGVFLYAGRDFAFEDFGV